MNISIKDCVASAIIGGITATVLNKVFIPGRTFVRTMDGVSIRTENIRWIQPDIENACYNVCTNAKGCRTDIEYNSDKWRICHVNSPKSFDYIKRMIDE